MNTYRLFTSASPLEDFHFTVKQEQNLVLVFVGTIIGEVNIGLELYEHAKSVVKIATVLSGNSDLRLNYCVRHYGKESESTFDLRGGLDDAAQKKSDLKIIFESGCTGAIGSEKEKVTLLSSKAKNIASPTILCNEESVTGTHGISTGHIDSETRKYFESRGISRDKIKKMLVAADIATIVNSIRDKNVLKSVHEALRNA